jgi:HTH-type transcriptional regulator / antitoxin HipB
MSIPTPTELGATVRSRRRQLGLSQAETAKLAAVSRLWINEFEGGKSTVELGHVLAILTALDFSLELTTPDREPPDTTPTSPRPGPSLDDLIAAYDRGDR